MAIGTISFEQRPIAGASKIPAITNWTPVVPYMALQTDITDLFYFKFILEVRLDDASGTLLGKIKQRPNGYATGTTDVYALFDVRDIINTQLKTTYESISWNASSVPPAYDVTGVIHKVGENDTSEIFSHNQNQLRQIYVKVYQSYSESQTEIPSINNTVNADNTKYYMAASLPLETPRSSGTYFQGTQFQIFQTKDANGRFLSDVQKSSLNRDGSITIAGVVFDSKQYINYVQWNDSTNVGDYHTLAFLNSASTFDSEISIMDIRYYDAAGGSVGSYTIANNNTNGGSDPVTSSGETDTDPEKLLYFGCGPGNLEAQTIDANAKPSNNSGWVFYTITGKDDTTSPGPLPVTDIYYFVKQDVSCKGYVTRRLGWRNSLGCWDYYNFKMKSSQSVDVKRDTYGKVIGEFNSTKYSYNNYDSSKKVRKTSAILKETLNTDFIREEDADLIEKCLMSTDVFVIGNEDNRFTLPVLVTNKSIKRKTSVNDGIKIQYTIQIEYANPLNTNS